jgi:hypothetical protein
LPVISQAELEELLVPDYLAKIPELDGWDGAYEVRMHPGLPGLLEVPDLPEPLLSIRSAGADGAFDTDTYTRGPYPPAEAGRDIVWVDGYFASLPQS